MQELIKLTQQTLNNTEVNTVNARELHEFLDVGRDFTTWIKGRLSTLGSIENEDYLLTKTGSSSLVVQNTALITICLWILLSISL